MKSIIIPINHTHNQSLFYKIEVIAKQLNISSRLEIATLTTFCKVFKNNPIPNNQKTIQNILPDIIQIIQQLTENQKHKAKTPTYSAVNNAIWKIVNEGGMIRVDGMYVLNNCFKDIDQVEQIVFRFS